MTEPPEPTVWGYTYHSTSITENGEPKPLVRGTRITLTFNAAERRLAAHAGCNSLAFDIKPHPRTLDAHSPISTLIGCSAALENQDRWLTEFLLLRPRLTISRTGIVLSDGRTRIELEVDPEE